MVTLHIGLSSSVYMAIAILTFNQIIYSTCTCTANEDVSVVPRKMIIEPDDSQYISRVPLNGQMERTMQQTSVFT